MPLASYVKPRFAKLLTGVVSVSLLSLLSGCGGTDDADLGLNGNAGDLHWDDSRFDSANFRLASESFMSLIGLGIGTADDEAQRRMLELQTQHEELVAQCMREAGFEYIPHLPASSTENPGNINSREFRAAYGFGYFPRPLTADEWEAVAQAQQQDPNLAIIENMTESEALAYQLALQGPPDLRADDGTPLIGGCQGWANEQLTGQWADNDGDNFSQSAADLWNSDEFAPLRSAFNLRFVNLEDYPLVAELQADWADCMADAGWPDLMQRSQALEFSQARAEAFTFEWTENWQTGEMKPGWETALPEALQADIDLALTDFDCAEAVNFSRRHNAVIFAIDQQFLDDHASEFAALKSAAEQSR